MNMLKGVEGGVTVEFRKPGIPVVRASDHQAIIDKYERVVKAARTLLHGNNTLTGFNQTQLTDALDDLSEP